MSQTPTYWRKVKLRLIDGAVAYAEIAEREAAGEDLGRALSTAHSRYRWDLFELGPRNISAMAERALCRAKEAAGDPSAETIQNLANRANEMARAEIHCNHADKARRDIWWQANDRYGAALEALGPLRLAEMARRDLAPAPSDATHAYLEDDGQSAAEGTEAPRP